MMPLKKYHPAALAVLALATVLFPAFASAELVLRLDAERLTVNGATPNARVVFYGFSHEIEDYVGVIAKHSDIVLADAAGSASYALHRPISSRSLWFAVDLESGSTAFAVPDGFPLRRMDAPPAAVNRRDGFDDLEVPFDYADVLAVRPSKGAWSGDAKRGGPKDLKVRRDILAVDLRRLRQIRGSDPGPANVKRGDVVIVVDPYALAFFTLRWEK